MSNLYGSGTPPITSNTFDTTVDLGLSVAFTSSAEGVATGVRYYVANSQQAAHVIQATAELFNVNGILLATKQFTLSSTVGWQSIPFDAGVNLVPNATYYATVAFDATGTMLYGAQSGATFPVVNQTLTATSAGAREGTGYLDAPTAPITSTNFFVDIDVEPPPPINGTVSPSRSTATATAYAPLLTVTGPGAATAFAKSAAAAAASVVPAVTAETAVSGGGPANAAATARPPSVTAPVSTGSPTPSWNTVRVFGTWINQDGTRKTGTYKVTMPTRVTNATDDVIIPAGAYTQGTLSTVNGQPSLVLQIPASDDPDNTPSGVKPVLAVTFNDGATAETYALELPVASSGDPVGVNIRTLTPS